MKNKVVTCHTCGRELRPEVTVLIDFSPSSEILYFCSQECRDEFRRRRVINRIIDLMLERLYQRPKEEVISERLRQEIEEILQKKSEENDGESASREG